MSRSTARILIVLLATATLAGLGGCACSVYQPTWSPEGPQQVEDYAREFRPVVFYP